MRFSIIIPLYNKESYIQRTLKSVAEQTHQEYEVIVVDDGSTDNSAKIVESFPIKNLRLIKQVNQGESGARNTGIAAACFEYMAFLDADDAWENDHLENLCDLIGAYPGAGLYCSGYKFIESNNRIMYPYWFNIPEKGIIGRYFDSVAKGDQVATSSSACIPATVFQNVGVFAIGDRLGADQDMWARVALNYEIAVTSKATAIYYRNADNRVCLNVVTHAELPYSIRLQDYIDKNSSSLQDYLIRDIQNYINKGLLTLISLRIRAGDKRGATKLLEDPRLKMLPRAFFWRLVARFPYVVQHAMLTSISLIRCIFTRLNSRTL